MFLIEGDGKAVLYTGDIRAEAWWICHLARHPVMVPYTSGIKTLDKIYLDTTHADPDAKHLEFSPKVEGIAELIREVERYPIDTIFHLNTWTFGYEDVWVALGAHFQTQIHVDDWRYDIFRSIQDKSAYEHGPFLCGFSFGNTMQRGILTKDPSVRFHSCERGNGCEGLNAGKRMVHISPLIMKKWDPETKQVLIMREIGESGGGGDLNKPHYLECDKSVLAILHHLAPLEIKIKIEKLAKTSQNSIPISLDFEDERSLSIDEITQLLVKSLDLKEKAVAESSTLPDNLFNPDEALLLDWFGFPFSRHSSYNELRDLVAVFKPLDVYPCVVPEAIWHQAREICELFGDICSGTHFAFDEEQRSDKEARRKDRLMIEAAELKMRQEAGLDLPSSPPRESQITQEPTQQGQKERDDVKQDTKIEPVETSPTAGNKRGASSPDENVATRRAAPVPPKKSSRYWGSIWPKTLATSEVAKPANAAPKKLAIAAKEETPKLAPTILAQKISEPTPPTEEKLDGPDLQMSDIDDIDVDAALEAYEAAVEGSGYAWNSRSLGLGFHTWKYKAEEEL